MERLKIKEYIITNYPDAKEGDQMNIMDDMIDKLNSHCSVEEIQSIIYEINNPPSPTEEELDSMTVSALDEVAKNKKWIPIDIDGYDAMRKKDKIYAIKVSLKHIIPEVTFEEPLNEEQ